AFNIKTRTDTKPGNEFLGYDPTDPVISEPDGNPRINCTPNGDGTHADDGSGTGTWSCTITDDPCCTQTRTFSDKLIQHLRSQIRNDAAGWDDPACTELGCGFM